MKPKLDYSLINYIWHCEVLIFKLERDVNSYPDNYIELTVGENGKNRILRFSNPSQLEFESRYSNHGLALELTDCSDNQLENLNLSVSGHVNGIGNFSFWAKDVTEV